MMYSKWLKNDDIVEKLCRLLKHTMRCLRKDFSPFMREVF